MGTACIQNLEDGGVFGVLLMMYASVVLDGMLRLFTYFTFHIAIVYIHVISRGYHLVDGGNWKASILSINNNGGMKSHANLIAFGEECFVRSCLAALDGELIDLV
jgi:hypothetical protein